MKKKGKLVNKFTIEKQIFKYFVVFLVKKMKILSPQKMNKTKYTKVSNIEVLWSCNALGMTNNPTIDNL